MSRCLQRRSRSREGRFLLGFCDAGWFGLVQRRAFWWLGSLAPWCFWTFRHHGYKVNSEIGGGGVTALALRWKDKGLEEVHICDRDDGCCMTREDWEMTGGRKHTVLTFFSV